ncbi:hypothetical protein CALCODRAFT_503052 [Calocera cornea HHB12733]|uniref:Uncharacterized protein n=1 Tax=Calocera cornea HHB12733 TaxID=1353952 RepID=A0A165D0T9_9BASI|nr:hypothetical protein CALCODRAFT_503052 [Calocera cornea HHB12733]
MADSAPRPEAGPSSPATQSSHGTIPFPRLAPSADDVAGLAAHVRARSESAEEHEPYDVRTSVEHQDRFRTVVRTVISLQRRARRQSEPGPRPSPPPEEHELQERDAGPTRGRAAPVPRSQGVGAGYPSIGDRLASGEREPKRVSFEGDEAGRAGLFARLYSTTSRTSDRSDPLPMSPAQAARMRSPLSPAGGTSPPRNASPLRRWIRSRRDPKELYSAREHDPFHWHFSPRRHKRHSAPLPPLERTSPPPPPPPPPSLPDVPETNVPLARAYVGFVLKQAYISLMLRLPALYFSRVGRLFMEADLTKTEMKRIVRCMHSPEWEFDLEIGEGGVMSQPLREFKLSWEEFNDHVIKEWKTLNLVSALLLTAILTLFQIEVSNEPVTHTCGLLSLVCALLSLLFGCMYIVRFSTMRTMSKAARWAEAAQESQTNPIWNVWIFLALPSVFLAWSLIFFIATILAYTWTSDPTVPPEYLAAPRSWISRAFVSSVVVLGMLALCGVVSTFKSYSDEAGSVPEAFGSPLINVHGISPRSSSEQGRGGAGAGSVSGTVSEETTHVVGATAGLGLSTGASRNGGKAG